MFAVQNRGVEQLVARWAHNPKAVGSSPTPATTHKSSELFQGIYYFLYPEWLLTISRYHQTHASATFPIQTI